MRRPCGKGPRAGLAALLAFLGGCAPRAAEPDPALVGALVAVHLLDARVALVHDVSDSARAALLARHGFTDASFGQALAALARRPLDYEATLAAVNESLGTRLRLLPTPPTPPPAMMPPAPPSTSGPPPP